MVWIGTSALLSMCVMIADVAVLPFKPSSLLSKLSGIQHCPLRLKKYARIVSMVAKGIFYAHASCNIQKKDEGGKWRTAGCQKRGAHIHGSGVWRHRLGSIAG